MKELNLGNKVTNNTPIIKAHSGSICVEDTSNSNLKIEKMQLEITLISVIWTKIVIICKHSNIGNRKKKKHHQM